MEYAIAHHGIQGQKWGVRRYQNPDGSLTELGKERYAHEARIVNRARLVSSKSYKQARVLEKKAGEAWEKYGALYEKFPNSAEEYARLAEALLYEVDQLDLEAYDSAWIMTANNIIDKYGDLAFEEIWGMWDE